MHMLQSLFLSDVCSTCFGYHCHPSSEAQTTVTTASGNRYTILLSVAIVEELEHVHLVGTYILEYYYDARTHVH